MPAPFALALCILASPLLLSCTSQAREGTGLWPLPRAEERPAPLSFGLYVTPDPDQNPINPPERFTGFHVATDFELLPGEMEIDIPVFAICEGKVRMSGFAEGYGGLLVQSCTINDEPATILYGHLTLDSLPEEDTRLHPGQRIGFLAPHRSYESGWNRKHLHLGIHRGRTIDLRGYVQTEEEIDDFMNPLSVLPL
jgi:hypothetical protein